MKKIGFLLIIFLCSCSINNELKSTCAYESKNINFSEKTVIDITYNGDDVLKEAVVTKKYKSLTEDGDEIISDIKSSVGSFNNKYGDSGIKYSVLKDESDYYVVKYFVPGSASNKILQDFKLNKNTKKVFQDFKKNNIECE